MSTEIIFLPCPCGRQCTEIALWCCGTYPVFQRGTLLLHSIFLTYSLSDNPEFFFSLPLFIYLRGLPTKQAVTCQQRWVRHSPCLQTQNTKWIMVSRGMRNQPTQSSRKKTGLLTATSFQKKCHLHVFEQLWGIFVRCTKCKDWTFAILRLRALDVFSGHNKLSKKPLHSKNLAF